MRAVNLKLSTRLRAICLTATGLTAAVASMIVIPSRPPLAAPSKYDTATVQQGAMVRQVTGDGVVESAATYDVTFSGSTLASSGADTSTSGTAANPANGDRSSAVVTNVYVTQGSRVRRSQVLARRDRSMALLTLQSAEDAYTAALAAAANPQTTSSVQDGGSAPVASSGGAASGGANPGGASSDAKEVAAAAGPVTGNPPPGNPTPGGGNAKPGAGKPAPTSGSATPGRKTPSATKPRRTVTSRSAEAALLEAQAAVLTARTTLLSARRALTGTVLRSPVGGTVTEMTLLRGSTPPSGAALVVQSRTMRVAVDIPETDIAGMKVGQPANVTISALNTTVSGKVAAIGTASGSYGLGSTTTVTFPVTITLDSRVQHLRAGMSAGVTITTGSRADVLSVPVKAIHRSGAASTVQVLDAHNHVRNVRVRLGLVSDANAEIVSGLTAGQTVVTGLAQTSGSNGASQPRGPSGGAGPSGAFGPPPPGGPPPGFGGPG